MSERDRVEGYWKVSGPSPSHSNGLETQLTEGISDLSQAQVRTAFQDARDVPGDDGSGKAGSAELTCRAAKAPRLVNAARLEVEPRAIGELDPETVDRGSHRHADDRLEGRGEAGDVSPLALGGN